MSSEFSRRLLLSRPPFSSPGSRTEWNRRGEWPARWISCDDPGQLPLVAAYKLTFNLEEPQKIVFHTTGDDRYRLFLNGTQIGSGSERGDVEHWYFETYEVQFAAGTNSLVAQVWSLGEDSAFAQFSLRHEFLLCPDDPTWVKILATGIAPWQVKKLPGYRFVNPQVTWGTGFNLILDGEAMHWGFEFGAGEGWRPAIAHEIAVSHEGNNDKSPRRLLQAAVLPPRVDSHWRKARVRHISFPAPGPTAPVPFRPEENLNEEMMDWTRLIIGHPLVIPPYSRRRVLLDLYDYVCAYPELTVSKGRQSQVRINWQEALFDKFRQPEKGNRDEIENKYFCTISSWEDGVGDTFLPDGGSNRSFTTFWWQAGRYVEVVIQTQLEELVIESLDFREDRYPFENQLRFSSDDDRLEQVGNLAFRTLQMCSHETYMDCPYYEQLQYIGDTRLQVLVTYLCSSDDRLPRKALQLFDNSRQLDGVTQSRYPSRVIQIIPPFSMWWICMIWDFALWRGDKSFVRKLMPGARVVLDWFREFVGASGLVEAPVGWNFVDWVPGWRSGMPIGADDGASSIINRQFEIALRKMAELETWVGEPEMAERHLRTASEIAFAVHRSFWNSKRAMYADDLAQTSFSEHAQVLSILTEALPERIERLVAQGLLTEKELHRTTVYFSHYLFECLARLGRTDQILERLSLWTDHLKIGMKTIVEMPEPTRSDCHAWGSHPLYHYVASLLGVKPRSLGSRELLIHPNLGGLSWIQAKFPFGGGQVEVNIRGTPEGMAFDLSIPNGVTASASHRENHVELPAGVHSFCLE